MSVVTCWYMSGGGSGGDVDGSSDSDGTTGVAHTIDTST